MLVCLRRHRCRDSLLAAPPHHLGGERCEACEGARETRVVRVTLLVLLTWVPLRLERRVRRSLLMEPGGGGLLAVRTGKWR